MGDLVVHQVSIFINEFSRENLQDQGWESEPAKCRRCEKGTVKTVRLAVHQHLNGAAVERVRTVFQPVEKILNPQRARQPQQDVLPTVIHFFPRCRIGCHCLVHVPSFLDQSKRRSGFRLDSKRIRGERPHRSCRLERAQPMGYCDREVLE